MKSNIAFGKWLDDERKSRGWTKADLSRASGISGAHITRIISGQRGVGFDSAQAIAKAFRISPDTVYGAAGLSTPKQKDQAMTNDLIYKFNQLPYIQKLQIMDFTDFLVARLNLGIGPDATGQPMSEEELVQSLKILAAASGYRVEEWDLLQAINSAQKASVKKSDRGSREQSSRD